MPYSILPPPVLYIADCTEEPPRNLVEEFLDPELVNFAHNHPDISNMVLWSRLIIKSVPFQSSEEAPPQLDFIDDFSTELEFSGDWFKYCSVDYQNKWVAVSLSILPVNVSLKWFNTSAQTKEMTRLKFPVIFNDWIDRQPDPGLAFYQLWATRSCLKKRKDPTIRIVIGEDDQLDVVGASIMLRESLMFWKTDDWICAVQGPALASLLTEIRKPEKTVYLLEKFHRMYPEIS